MWLLTFVSPLGKCILLVIVTFSIPLSPVLDLVAYGSLPVKVKGKATLVALGDWGCSPTNLRVVRMIEEINPDLVLGLGDYVFDSNTSCFFDMIKPFDDKMKIAFGNHDVTFPSVLKEYIEHFNLKRQYYSYEYQNIHFTVISTEIPFKKDSPQYDFVDRDLTKASKDPNVDWLIVYFHKPAYTTASYDTRKAASLRDTYHPLFDTYGVDLVLQAHNHKYERTYPLTYNPFN
jgi:hypothetical protein